MIKNWKKPFVALLVGPPLCGKSTWIKNNFEDDEVTIISRDEIVMDIYGDDNYDEAFSNVDQKKVNYALERKMIESSESGLNVIVDMTNMSSKRRRHTLSYFSESYYKIAVIFPLLEWDEFVRRNNKRRIEENKTIPENVIKSMISSYQSIRENEGFDKILSI